MAGFWRNIGTATLLFGLLGGCGPAAGNPQAGAATPPPPAATTPTPGKPLDLLLVRDPVNSGDLWRSSRDGAEGELLLSGLTDAPCVSSGAIVATLGLNGPSQLVSYALPGGPPATIISDTSATLRQPTCHPKSDALIYLRQPLELAEDEPPPPSLWRTSLGGAAPVPANPAGDIPGLNARWSPDGARLLFELAEQPRLVMIDQAQAVAELSFTGTYAWSPDGARVVISKREDGADSRFRQLILLEAATGAQTVLLDDPAADVYFPAWSSDGTQIAFIRRPLGQGAGELWSVALADPAAPRQLTDDPAYDNFDPQWSPDSAELVWSRVTVDQPRYSIWRRPLAGSAPPALVAENALWPRWAPSAK